MADFADMIQTQWWTAKIIADKPNNMDYNGWLQKGDTGFATVLDNGRVVVLAGKGMPVSFKSVAEARKYATCITKCDNKATLATQAWNNSMW